MTFKHEDVIEKMEIQDKAGMFSGKNAAETVGYEKYGIPSIYMADGPHGLRKQAGATDHLGLHSSRKATCFPTAATVANSWDEELAQRIGEGLGQEAATLGVNIILGPGLNIKRNPLCGRNFEYFSEDPYLSGKMAAAYIRGIQSEGVAACPKHFAVNSQETCRMASNSVVDERTLRELYLTGFEIAVKEGNPKTIMSSYNEVNGIYANENSYLLQDILVKEWGFDGMVISDWGGSNDHALGVKNGSHLEMPGTGEAGKQDILKAMKSGLLTEDILNERLDKILDIVFDLKACETKTPKTMEDWAEDHHRLARKAAEESIVLLKNEDNILPLNKEMEIVVIGDFAEKPRYQGAGSSLVAPLGKPESILDCIGSVGLRVCAYESGYSRNHKPDSKKMEKAKEAAKHAGAVLIFAGLDENSESEGKDRNNMKMPEAQNRLIEEICKVNPNVVVVLSAGSVIEMPWADRVKGIIHGFLGGQAGASAMCKALAGEINPSGKLAETYPFQYEDVPSAEYYLQDTRACEYREGLYAGYRYYVTAQEPVRFCFGYGLSYTTFSYRELLVEEDKVSFTIRNEGKREGTEIAQLYVGRTSDTVFRPERELKGFIRVTLQPGEEKNVSIPFDDKTFRFFDTRSHTWEIEAGTYELLIGSNVEEIQLKGTLEKEGTVTAGAYERQELPHYFSGRVENIEREEFQRLYGREIPDSQWSDIFQMNDPVCRLNHGKLLLGKAWWGILKILLKASEHRGRPDLNVLFNYNMPIRGYAKFSGGKISVEMTAAVTEMINGHRLRGLKQLFAAIHSKRKMRKAYKSAV